MKTLKITEKVGEQCMTTELRVVAIVTKESKVVTESRTYGKYGQEVHRFHRPNFRELMRTGWFQWRIADGCTITYNLIGQED